MAAAAAEQQRSAQDSGLSFMAELKQARSAHAAASEAARAADLEAQAAEAAAQSAEQGLSKAQTMLQENKAKCYTEQQRCARLQVFCKQLLCSLSADPGFIFSVSREASRSSCRQICISSMKLMTEE